MNSKLVIATVAAAAALVAGVVLMRGQSDAPASSAAAPGAQPTGPAAAQAQAPQGAQGPGGAAAGQPARAVAAAPVALTPAAQAALQQFERLRGLPAGDASIALGRQLEAGITADNAEGYLQALLTATSAAEARAAGAAISRVGDSNLMRRMAGLYGSLQPEQRGRVLQVLEQARNPAAIEGLTSLFLADTSEKRSPLVMSALIGVANIGTMESVQVLLKQVTPANADYALLALDRVTSKQGIEMIRAAANGSKDAQSIPPHYLPALKRIAQGKS
jgi:hypothetical protein